MRASKLSQGTLCATQLQGRCTGNKLLRFTLPLEACIAAVMRLRSTAAGRNTMQQETRPVFEEGAALVLSKWTALGLAVENEWGGRNSRQKADDLIDEAIEWFYSRKGPVTTPRPFQYRSLSKTASLQRTPAVCAPVVLPHRITTRSHTWPVARLEQRASKWTSMGASRRYCTPLISQASEPLPEHHADYLQMLFKAGRSRQLALQALTFTLTSWL